MLRVKKRFVKKIKGIGRRVLSATLSVATALTVVSNIEVPLVASAINASATGGSSQSAAFASLHNNPGDGLPYGNMGSTAKYNEYLSNGYNFTMSRNFTQQYIYIGNSVYTPTKKLADSTSPFITSAGNDTIINFANLTRGTNTNQYYGSNGDGTETQYSSSNSGYYAGTLASPSKNTAADDAHYAIRLNDSGDDSSYGNKPKSANSKAKKGKLKCLYYDVGTYYKHENGKVTPHKIDVLLTVEDWKVHNYSEGAKSPIKYGGILRFTTDRVGIDVEWVDWVKITYSFYESGSYDGNDGDEITVKGTTIFKDIDYGQSVSLPASYFTSTNSSTNNEFGAYKSHITSTSIGEKTQLNKITTQFGSAWLTIYDKNYANSQVVDQRYWAVFKFNRQSFTTYYSFITAATNSNDNDGNGVHKVSGGTIKTEDDSRVKIKDGTLVLKKFINVNGTEKKVSNALDKVHVSNSDNNLDGCKYISDFYYYIKVPVMGGLVQVGWNRPISSHYLYVKATLITSPESGRYIGEYKFTGFTINRSEATKFRLRKTGNSSEDYYTKIYEMDIDHRYCAEEVVSSNSTFTPYRTTISNDDNVTQLETSNEETQSINYNVEATYDTVNGKVTYSAKDIRPIFYNEDSTTATLNLYKRINGELITSSNKANLLPDMSSGLGFQIKNSAGKYAQLTQLSGTNNGRYAFSSWGNVAQTYTMGTGSYISISNMPVANVKVFETYTGSAPYSATPNWYSTSTEDMVNSGTSYNASNGSPINITDNGVYDMSFNNVTTGGSSSIALYKSVNGELVTPTSDVSPFAGDNIEDISNIRFVVRDTNVGRYVTFAQENDGYVFSGYSTSSSEAAISMDAETARIFIKALPRSQSYTITESYVGTDRNLSASPNFYKVVGGRNTMTNADLVNGTVYNGSIPVSGMANGQTYAVAVNNTYVDNVVLFYKVVDNTLIEPNTSVESDGVIVTTDQLSGLRFWLKTSDDKYVVAEDIGDGRYQYVGESDTLSLNTSTYFRFEPSVAYAQIIGLPNGTYHAFEKYVGGANITDSPSKYHTASFQPPSGSPNTWGAANYVSSVGVEVKITATNPSAINSIVRPDLKRVYFYNDTTPLTSAIYIHKFINGYNCTSPSAFPITDRNGDIVFSESDLEDVTFVLYSDTNRGYAIADDLGSKYTCTGWTSNRNNATIFTAKAHGDYSVLIDGLPTTGGGITLYEEYIGDKNMSRTFNKYSVGNTKTSPTSTPTTEGQVSFSIAPAGYDGSVKHVSLNNTGSTQYGSLKIYKRIDGTLAKNISYPYTGNAPTKPVTLNDLRNVEFCIMNAEGNYVTLGGSSTAQTFEGFTESETWYPLTLTNGNFSIQYLPVASYIIKERYTGGNNLSAAPVEYTLDYTLDNPASYVGSDMNTYDDGVYVEFNKNQLTATVTVNDVTPDENYGSIEIRKCIDGSPWGETNKILSGNLQLSVESGTLSFVKNLSMFVDEDSPSRADYIDDNGYYYYRLDNLPAGTYTIIESYDGIDASSSPNYYAVSTTNRYVSPTGSGKQPYTQSGVTVTVSPNTTTYVNFNNVTYSTPIRIHKSVNKRANGISNLSGITFTLSGTTLSGKTVSQTATTNASGDAVFPAVKAGNYTISESAPSSMSYYMDFGLDGTGNHNISVSYEDANEGIDLEYDYINVITTVELTKVNPDDTSEKISGATFAVYTDVNKNGTYEAGVDTLLKVSNTPVTLTESASKPGYYYLEGLPMTKQTDGKYMGYYLIKEEIGPSDQRFAVDQRYYPVVFDYSRNILTQTVSNNGNGLFAETKATADITLRKRIPINEINGGIWYEHGTPTFILELTGAGNADGVKYRHSYEFTEEYVASYLAAHPGSAYVEMEHTWYNVPTGLYTATEVNTVRYTLTQITGLSLKSRTTGNNISTNASTDKIYRPNDANKPNTNYAVQVNLCDDYHVSATFVNQKNTYKDFTHNSLVVNDIL